MKDFWIRMISAAAIVISLMGYNSVLEARAKEEEIAKLNAELEGVRLAGIITSDTSENTMDYKDGVYTGEADGFGGIIAIEVTIEDKKIADIKITSAENEDGAYLTMAEDIIPSILEKQSAEVDTISGATFSSGGIKNAVKQALEKAAE